MATATPTPAVHPFTRCLPQVRHDPHLETLVSLFQGLSLMGVSRGQQEVCSALVGLS